MKKHTLVIFILIGSLFAGCKKDGNSVNTSSKMQVRYNFSMDGVPSTITYNSINDNKTTSLNNIVTTSTGTGIPPAYSVTDFVSSGDYVHLTMSTQNKIVGYIIYITYVKKLDNGSTSEGVIASSQKVVVDNSGNNTLTLDKTFTADDFK